MAKLVVTCIQLPVFPCFPAQQRLHATQCYPASTVALVSPRKHQPFRTMASGEAHNNDPAESRVLTHLPPLKRRLESGSRLYGAFLTSFSPVMAEILGWSGYDFVVVDMEHGPGDTFEALPVLRALELTKTPAIVRIPDNDPVMAKKALDLGPAGIMIPMVDSPEAARKAVAACRYPLKGVRGAAAPVVRASRYGLDVDYLEHCEDDLLIMVQVESEKAVGCIQEIASVEGVDCIQMGPTDLSASCGCIKNPGDPKVTELLHKAEQTVLLGNSKTYLSGFAMPDDPPQSLFARSYHMVSGAVDVVLFRNAAIADLKLNKPSLPSEDALLLASLFVNMHGRLGFLTMPR